MLLGKIKLSYFFSLKRSKSLIEINSTGTHTNDICGLFGYGCKLLCKVKAKHI